MGEELFSAITYLDFPKCSSTVFPWLRASLLGTIVSSPRSQDGFGKILSKADVERLKSPALRDVVLTAEKLLSLNHDVLQKQAFAKTAEGLSLMGRCMVRTCLHLCKKQAKGRDTKEYQDLAEISALFGSELLAIKDGKSFLASSPEAPEEAAAVKPQTLQDCCCIPVQACLFFLGLLQGKQFDSSLKQSTQC